MNAESSQMDGTLSSSRKELYTAGALLLVPMGIMALWFDGFMWMVGAGLCWGWFYFWALRNLHRHQGAVGPHASLGGGFWVSWLRVFLPWWTFSVLCQFSLWDSYPWLSFGLYSVLMLLDAVDGFAARLSGTVSDFGARLDNQLDGIGILAASLIGVLGGKLPYFYLSLSGIYVAFHLGLTFRGWRGWPVRRDRMMQSVHNRFFAGAHMVLFECGIGTA